MPATPYVTIDLDKIEHNTRAITALCRAHGIEVSGVTKGVCGHPGVAQAMLRGGVESIADSRLENIARMRLAGVDTAFMMVRLPPLSAAGEIVDATGVSLNSEPALLEALSAAARDHGTRHDILLMVDLGDRREGVCAEELPALVDSVLDLPGIRIKGLGTNLACFGGVVPSAENMQRLVTLADEIEREFNLSFEWISAINSSGLQLIASGRMPERINHARIGEAILLGRETTQRKPWPETFQDAFTIHAEVLELKRKPSLPAGERAENAFGDLPEFRDRGTRLRALLNLGREDVDVSGLTPCEPGVNILGASSGYLVADLADAGLPLRVGDRLTFRPGYSALLATMTSEYVKKVPLRDNKPVEKMK